jgi:hypothetical protein
VLVYRGWSGLVRRRANCRAAAAEVALARQGRILHTWLEAVENQNVSELTSWAVRCLTGGKLGKAWRPWAQEARTRVAARGALQRWVAGELGAALQRWHGVVLQWRNLQLGVLASGLHYEGAFTLKIFGAWRTQAKRQGVVRLIVGGNSRRSLLRRGWSAARDHAAMARVAQAGGLAATGYSDAQLKRQALLKWRSAALTSSALQGMFHASASALLRTALRCWVRGGAKYMAAEQSAMAALAYWSGASCKSCWVLWRLATSGRMAQMGNMHQAGLMLRNSNLTRYLACWRAAAEARAEQLRKLRVAAGRMCNRLLAMCFGACMALVTAKRQREEAALQCVVRMLNCMLVMTWEAWRGQVEERRQAMRACGAMAARALGREHLAAFLSWREQTESSIRGEQIHALLGDKVQALEMGSKSGVLKRWTRQYWQERVMLSMTRRDETLVAAAFEALGGAARARQLLRRVAEMGFAGKKTQQRLWLQRWRRLAAHRAALRLRQEYLLSRTTWYARQAILGHWKAAKTARANDRRALARYCFSLCHHVLRAWHAHVATACTARDELLRAHANQLVLEQHRRRARARRLVVVVGAWREAVRGAVYRRRLLRGARLDRAWRRWASKAARGARCADACYVIEQRRGCRVLRAVVRGWHAHLQERRNRDAAFAADQETRLVNADAYYLQRLGGLVFFYWRALSWSRNWEKPGRFCLEPRHAHGRPEERGSEQQRQRHMAALLVRGSVAHQSSASKAFQQGLYSPAAGSPLSPPRSRGVPRGERSRGEPRSRSPFRRVSFDEADEPTTRAYPSVMSPMGMAVAVALGSHLVDEPRPAVDSPQARSERRARALTPQATPRSGRRLFESTSRASNANGFASFGDWVALQTNG